MIKIIPDYNKQHKCFFCKKNEAVEKSASREKMYCVTKKHYMPLGYDYITVEIEIPRCPNCEKKHNYSCLPMVICFLVLFILSLIKVIIPDWTQNGFWGNVLVVFMMILLSFAGGFLLGYIPRIILSKILKVKFEDFNKDYSPIKKLIGIGFSIMKPDPSTLPEVKYNEELFKRTLQSIIKEDACIVIKR